MEPSAAAAIVARAAVMEEAHPPIGRHPHQLPLRALRSSLTPTFSSPGPAQHMFRYHLSVKPEPLSYHGWLIR